MASFSSIFNLSRLRGKERGKRDGRARMPEALKTGETGLVFSDSGDVTS